jgi:hypothetical protein
MSLRRGLAVVCCLLGSWLGCAGKSEQDIAIPPGSAGTVSAGHGGTSGGPAAGRTGKAGGTGSGGRTPIGTGGTFGETDSAGESGGGNTGTTGGFGGTTGPAGRGGAGGSAGSIADSGNGGKTGPGGAGGGGVTGLGGLGANGGVGEIPVFWTCLSASYGDGVCDCGCGVPDPDCADAKVTSCDACSDTGSCGQSACPSSIDPNDNSICSVPSGWLCDSSYYGAGVCVCGCGVVDSDCASTDISACRLCTYDSCAPDNCSGLDPNDNALCTTPPPSWTCPSRLYRDGVKCDCGCGAFDPDCASLDASACDRCNSTGSCSDAACPGTITTNDNRYCTRPSPPAGWTCNSYNYADGYTCDCGCGVPDPDCATNDVADCQNCSGCIGACPASLDPNDVTQCAPLPPSWTCDPSQFRDGICDCGCGARDLDCYDVLAGYCDRCPDTGCAYGNCSHIDAADNSQCSIAVPSTWTCSPKFYEDGVCDCGCAVLDPDCSSLNLSACEFCNSTGSCSTAACPGTIVPSDNTSCSP